MKNENWIIETVEPYDVLQIEKDGKWLDFSTLRTESEIDHAKSLVSSHGAADWINRNFRIVRPCPFSIRYASPESAPKAQTPEAAGVTGREAAAEPRGKSSLSRRNHSRTQKSAPASAS